MSLSRKKAVVVVTICVSLALLLLLNPIATRTIRITVSTLFARVSSPTNEPFPSVNTNGLNDIQKKILNLTQEEYAKKPVSYDSNVLTYSEGAKESWCADFVSWIMKESDKPYSNPNSGHWRIPGVLTLQEYYKSEKRYIDANANYTPLTGDVAIYIGTKTLDQRSNQHTNIILKTDGDYMYTIGGNERGRLRIDKQNYKEKRNSLIGFGTLERIGN